MPEIRAFVGHSFSQDDAGIVTAFLSYLDELQRLLPSFTWVHAQDAEPRELAQKVLSLIDDRNVFIGICTRKERAIVPGELAPTWLPAGNLKGRADAFKWKTSDWVIQEIGLAVGRGMSLVLLLENGCRRPGGLQGDIEFIPFDRAAPEKAFVKLLEMIRALSPAARSRGAAATEAPPEPTSELPAAPTVDDDTPDASWNRDRYDQAFLWALISNRGRESEISDAYLQTVEASDEEKRVEWEAITECWRITTNRGGSLDRLRSLEARFPANPEILTRLASALSKFHSHMEAAERYLKAANAAHSDEVEAENLRGSAALQFVHAGRQDLAMPILNAQREWLKSHPDQEYSVLTTLRDIASASKDDDLSVEVMERIVELRPDDYETRFSLGYKHSERGCNEMALFHYLQIPPPHRVPATWNNLGVSHQQFRIPGKAVEAYRKSAAGGESLAMSNLGYKFMSAGFLKEAEEEFNRALKIENFHRNVGEGIAALRDVPEQEDEEEKEILEKAKPKIDYFRRLGRAIAQPAITSLPARWRGPDCELAVTITGDEFRASGEYEASTSAFGLPMALVKSTRHQVIYVGKIVGRRVDGLLERSTEGGPQPSLLSSFGDNKTKFSMIVEQDGRGIEVMQDMASVSPRFYQLTALV